MLRILAATFLSFTAASASYATETWEVVTLNLRLPFGSSYYDYQLPKPQNISPFQVFYTPTLNCRNFTMNVAVWYPGGSAWDPAVYDGSVFKTKDREAYSIQFTFDTVVPGQVCEISLVTLRDPATPAPKPQPQPEPEPEPQPEPEPELPGVWMDAGTLNFPGGVNKQGNLQLNSAYYARDLSITVPEECKDVRVDEAGILRQGIYTQARPVPNKPGIFRLDEISSFRQARVVLSGPEGKSCLIRVQVYDHT